MYVNLYNYNIHSFRTIVKFLHFLLFHNSITKTFFKIKKAIKILNF